MSGSVLQPGSLVMPPIVDAGSLVYKAYDNWSGIALQAFHTAQNLAAQIANIPLDPVAFNASFDPQIALAPFPTIDKPQVPAGLALNAPPLPGPPPTIALPQLPPLTYVSSLLGQMQQTLLMLLGGNPLPAAVADALRQRAYSESFREQQRAEAQTYDDFAARGFEEPPGMLNRRLSETRQAAMDQRQKINRDVYVQEQMAAIENLRAGLQAGVQLEGTNVQVFRAQADVQIETVKLAAQEQQMLLDGWRAQVQLYDTQLKGELARLDTVMKSFEAQVEAYKADAQIASAAGEYDNRRFQLNLAQEQAIVSTEMKRQDQQFEQMKYLSGVMLEIKKTLAQVGSSLASAAMSAVNIGAQVASHGQYGMDYHLGISYAGQLTSTD